MVFKNGYFINIVIPWSIAFLLLFFYYDHIEIPMERSFVKGLGYVGENKDAQAIGEFNKVTRVYPGYEPVYWNRAYLYHKNGQKSQALAAYQQARKINIVNSEKIFEHRAWGLEYGKPGNNLKDTMAAYNDHIVEHYFSTLLYSYERK